ncbi:DUF4185 domain-containing protein [Brachybacterium sp. AOP43-C2-M15]|uniref:DUF4185 domain-containing protein n=1 Tax=Brachybacterium sp. AOP43-C2-M15 TaxID=3457661 RepID=UPI0040337CEE
MRPTRPAAPTSDATAGDPPPGEEEVSRSGFLRGGALALGAGAVGTALASGPSALAAPTEGGDRRGGRGVDPNPDYRRPRITRLKTVTGPGITTRFRMEATDLGAPALTPDGRILVIFGDTFEEAAVGGGWWRSPVGLYADPRRRLDTGLSWTSAVGGETAEGLVEYEHDSDPVSTILPGDVLTVGDTMYVWVMVNHGFGNVGSTEIWTSEDSGETWERTAEMFPGDHLDGFSQQCTWALHPTDGHVYLLTTGFQRDKEAILQRVPQDSVLDPEAYETWGATGEGEDQEWAWGNDPTPVLGGEVGEMCLRIVEDRWVLTWFNAGLYRADVLIADSPTEIQEPRFTETLLWGCTWGQEDDERVAQLYGPYVLPGSTLEDMHLLCSQWNTGEGWPYHVQQYRVQGLGTAAGLG